MAFQHIFPIQQITPLIHFQWQQKWPCIRATELKPLIFKFITEEDGLQSLDPKTYAAHQDLIRDPKKSLFLPKNPDDQPKPSPYHLDILPQSEPKWYVPLAGSFPTKPETIAKQRKEEERLKTLIPVAKLNFLYDSPFFANAEALKPGGNTENLRLAVFYEKPIYIRISSFNPEVVNLVKAVLPYVIAFHNFGARKNKGFGSFFPVDKLPFDLEKAFLAYKPFVKVMKKTQKDSQPEKWLSTANGEYRLIKNKIAFAGGKPATFSLIRDYYAAKKVTWEKEYVSREIAQQGGKAPSAHIKYVRALLGLAELYDYPKLPEPIRKTKVIIHPLNKEIERFASPLYFKPTPGTLYLFATEIEKKMFGADFEFQGARKTVSLKTPDKSSFDWTAFLKTLKSWTHVK